MLLRLCPFFIAWKKKFKKSLVVSPFFTYFATEERRNHYEYSSHDTVDCQILQDPTRPEGMALWLLHVARKGLTAMWTYSWLLTTVRQWAWSSLVYGTTWSDCSTVKLILWRKANNCLSPQKVLTVTNDWFMRENKKEYIVEQWTTPSCLCNIRT